MEKGIIDIPEYSLEKGLKILWDRNFFFEVKAEENIINLKLNNQGLRSLARLLLSLTQENVPKNFHVHLDDQNSLEKGSLEIIIEKL